MKTNYIKALIATLLLIGGFTKASAAIDPTANVASTAEQKAGAIPCMACWGDPDPM